MTQAAGPILLRIGAGSTTNDPKILTQGAGQRENCTAVHGEWTRLVAGALLIGSSGGAGASLVPPGYSRPGDRVNEPGPPPMVFPRRAVAAMRPGGAEGR